MVKKLIILVETIFIVAAVEALIMTLLVFLDGHLSSTQEVLLDTLILSLVSAPLIYFFIIYPYIVKEAEVSAKLNKIYDNYSEHVIASNSDLKGIITYASAALCQISGYSEDELLGSPHSILRHPDTSPMIFEDMWATIQSGKLWTGEYKNQTKDGNTYWVIVKIKPEFDKDKNIIGYSSIRHDITQRKKNQEELLKSQARCASIGEMVGVIAHQWMQPIGTISASNANLKVRAELGNISNDYIIESTSNTDKTIKFISETINNFRNFFKENTNNIDISLLELIEYAMSISKPLVNERHIHLDFNFDRSLSEEDLIIKDVSKNDFAHILLNLINNSVDALLSNEVVNAKIEIYLEKEKDNFILTVQDNAGGIPEDIIECVFEKKITTKGEAGTGLGLYMTNMIVERNFKGKISAQNKEDGALFTLVLPQATS
ncbi:PAS domain S-box protein [Sulfurimonas sp.]|nr:PAS domain S-box protein [Sulfurimonas sp.]